MTKIDTYTASGVRAAATDLPKNMKGEVNLSLLAQAVRIYQNRLHSNNPVVKTRGNIVASNKKIWRQKGTGRARHGALSAPIFVGGGKAHGPKGVKRQLTLSKKLKQQALGSAINLKVKEKELVVVNGISRIKKTGQAAKMLGKITKDERKFTIALSDKNRQQERAFRNIKNVKVVPFSGLNAYKVYSGGLIILDKDAFGEKNQEVVKEKQKTAKKPVKR